jgi:hypothetical protein
MNDYNVILRKNGDYYHKQDWPTDLCNGDPGFCVRLEFKIMLYTVSLNFPFLKAQCKENNHIPGEERVLCAHVCVCVGVYICSYIQDGGSPKKVTTD